MQRAQRARSPVLSSRRLVLRISLIAAAAAAACLTLTPLASAHGTAEAFVDVTSALPGTSLTVHGVFVPPPEPAQPSQPAALPNVSAAPPVVTLAHVARPAAAPRARAPRATVSTPTRRSRVAATGSRSRPHAVVHIVHAVPARARPSARPHVRKNASAP